MHWILRVGNGKHFVRSSKFHLWGIDSKVLVCKGFINKVMVGDILWFVKQGGKIIAVAKFVSHNTRMLGELVNISKTNEELGWVDTSGGWDTEIHYKSLYDLQKRNVIINLKGQTSIRKYNSLKIDFNMPLEYEYIKKYKRKRKRMKKLNN